MKINDLFFSILSLAALSSFIISAAYPNLISRNVDVASLYITTACISSIFFARNIINYKFKKIQIIAICLISIVTNLIFAAIDSRAAGLGTIIATALNCLITIAYWCKFNRFDKKEEQNQ